MQISGLLTGYADSGAVDRKNESPVAAASKAGRDDSAQATGPSAMMDVMAGIVSDYDLTDITPRDFSEMLRELRDAGALTDAEYADLAQIRLDLDAENLDADDSVDLLKFYQRQADQTHPDNQSATAATQRHLDWLEKVAILQESPEAAGLNALV
jgi:hypothetical protein